MYGKCLCISAFYLDQFCRKMSIYNASRYFHKLFMQILYAFMHRFVSVLY